MEIIDQSHSITHVKNFAVKGAPTVEVNGFTSKGKTFIPAYISAKWSHGEGPNEVRIKGKTLKKDGTPGVNSGESFYYLQNPTWRAKEPAPDWIAELFA